MKKNFLSRFSCAVIPVILNYTLLAAEINFSRIINPFPVYDQNGTEIEFPFAGGLNRPVHQLVDIDGDNDLDLFIQERDRGFITFYQNIGNPSDFKLKWDNDQFEGIQIGSWFKFIDIDNDGDNDLFAEKPFGLIQYYQNEGSSTAAHFLITIDSLKDTDGQLIKFDGASIPEWSDIDEDNKADLFIGNITDGSITYYSHMGIDDNNLPLFKFVTDTFQGLKIITAAAKTYSQLNDQHKAAGHHGANSLTFVDIDGDNDNDLFWGDFFLESLIYIANLGSSQEPEFDMNSIIYNYPQNNPVLSGGFNIPRFADIDADNDYDMFIDVLGGYVSTTLNMAKNLFFYENIGSPDQPFFILRTEQLINSIDLGKNTIPAFTDIDNDGDPDLFVANETDLLSPNGSNSRLYLFENTGDKSNPCLMISSSHFLNYDNPFNGSNYAPAFIDIDNDNDQDLFLGQWDGKITFYLNEGNSNTANFTLQSENYAEIDVGSNSTPAFVDIDADGDFDLFIGEQSQNVSSGRVNFYINNGTKQDPAFNFVTTNYSNIDLGPGEFLYPGFTDIDNDGDKDLFIGSKSKGLALFINYGTPEVADFKIDSTFHFTTPQSQITPSFYDFDNDGDMDIIAGCKGGGLLYFENTIVSGLLDKTAKITESFNLAQNYPNPFNSSTIIHYQLPVSNRVELSIYNLIGQKLATLVSKKQLAGNYSVEWDATGFSSGVYLYTLKAGNSFKQTRKLVLLK